MSEVLELIKVGTLMSTEGISISPRSDDTFYAILIEDERCGSPTKGDLVWTEARRAYFTRPYTKINYPTFFEHPDFGHWSEFGADNARIFEEAIEKIMEEYHDNC